jgi:hypothetical protein
MDLSRLNDRLQRFFQGEAELTGKVTFFTRRRSKVTASRLLQCLVFGWLANPLASLNDLAAFFTDHWGIRVSPQGLDARIHRYTVAFFKSMCQDALLTLCHPAKLPVPVLTQFSEVNMTDSTGISLPACLKKRWPGSGGDASPAGLKLQLVFEFLTGSFRKVWITNGRTPDQAITRHISGIRPRSLNLFDLGYFAIDRLRRIQALGAYFLCRLLPKTNVYDAQGQKMDLLGLLRQESRDRFECLVQLGSRHPVPCRLCCFRAPEAVVNRRRRQARRAAKKRGRTPSKETLYLLGWTIFLTNVPASMVDLEQVASLYALRWQIELVFKLWKSQMRIDHIAGFRKERVQVELYAKLIGLVLFRCVAMPLRSEVVDLSPAKAFKRVAEYAGRLAEQLAAGATLCPLLEKLHQLIRGFAKREKRKTRMTTVQKLLVGGDCYA